MLKVSLNESRTINFSPFCRPVLSMATMYYLLDCRVSCSGEEFMLNVLSIFIF